MFAISAVQIAITTIMPSKSMGVQAKYQIKLTIEARIALLKEPIVKGEET